MRKSLILSGALSLVAAALPAQTVRWNDRPTATWQDDAPRVRVIIEGSRSVRYGAPMRVRFEASENAYVTVVRVDDQGRMTILFPYSRTQRAAVRGNTVHYVRNPRLGNNTAFLANDRMGGGYIFALASYAPLDFSKFQNRDYDRIGGYSAFTVANRNIARRPDVFIDRFAASVLWDVNTPYDYDVDYYFPAAFQSSNFAFNAYSLCSSMFDEFGAFTFGRNLMWDWNDTDFVGYPYRSMCRSYYQNLRCMSALALYTFSSCRNYVQVVQTPTTPPGKPADTAAFVPNEGVVKGGMQAPTPVPIIPGGGPEPPPVERLAGRFDQARAGEDLDNIKSIPARATRKMKEDDARRTAGGASPSRDRFDGASASKPEKNRTASADAPARVQPPSREPTKSKATGETRRDTGRDTFGSTRSGSEPRSNGPDRVSRPVEPKTTAPAPGSTVNPGTFSGASTSEKKKPPQD